jgi:ribosomal protein S12 methylthiotransferase accessory factor
MLQNIGPTSQEFLTTLTQELGAQLRNLNLHLWVARQLNDFTCTGHMQLPALFVSASRAFIIIGPHFVPGASICPACFMSATERGAVDAFLHDPPGSEEARVVASWIRQYDSSGGLTSTSGVLRAAMVSIELPARTETVHPLFQLRNCPNCRKLLRPVDLGLQVHCSRLTGIVRRVDVTTRQIAGAWRATAEWLSPPPLPGARPLLRPQHSYGRGTTKEEAISGCIGEAIERYSLIYRGDEALVYARAQDLRSIHPNSIQLFSPKQYEHRITWNRGNSHLFFVPEAFDSRLPADWLPATDLIDGSTSYAPAACCLMWYKFRPGEREWARADTNGCGSGWTLEEALLHALLEVVERDAISIWWYNRIRRPGVRLESFNCPQVLGVRDGLLSLGRTLVILDVTTDIGIPTYVSVAARLDGTEPLFASASHPCSRVAAWKAASEVGQLWFGLMHTRCVQSDLRRWIYEATLRNMPYLGPFGFVDASTAEPPLSIQPSLKYVVSCIERCRLRPFVVDLTRSDTILNTVRVIVPGMRHVWNRRAPGRLYDVPVAQGWSCINNNEEELNSFCCML